MNIKAGQEGSNRRTQSTMVSKQISTRRAGRGQKLLSGTRDQLLKDLQRVHKLFPTAVPDRDFYRRHGKYADAAWKEYFPLFKDFVGAAGLKAPFSQLCWYLDQTAELLKQHGEDLSEQELKSYREKLDRLYAAFLAATEEEIHL